MFHQCYCVVVGSRRHCSRRLIVQTLVFSRSYLHRQVSPPETLVVKGGTTWARNGRWILPANARLPRNIQWSFICRKSTTWDKRLYFPSEGRRAEDFFALKNPTTWVPKASKLPLDHRRVTTRTTCLYIIKVHILPTQCIMRFARFPQQIASTSWSSQ